MPKPHLTALIHEDKRVESIIASKCTIAPNGRGLQINSDLDFPEWEALLRQLAYQVDSLQWIIGDLIAYGELKFDPSKYERVMEVTNRAYSTVARWGSISRKYLPAERTFNLSHTHYLEAMDVQRDDRTRLLASAEREKWPVQRVRKEAAELARTIEVEISVADRTTLASPSVIGRNFEDFVLRLLRMLIPDHTWDRLGALKHNERGLDFVGRPFGISSDRSVIGVQAKSHAEHHTPTELEWLKFLAGCFTRRVTKALFITTGRLTSEQYREAGESELVTVIAGEELSHLVAKHGLNEFDRKA